MKAIILNIVLLIIAGPALAIDKSDLDGRIFALTGKFDELQQMPDKRIPPEILRKAQGIILLDRTRAGFLFAYQGGSGVAMAKDSSKGRWSPVAFLNANEASLGFQIGAEQNFFVIVLMSTNAPRLLTDPNFEFGGEARGTAGRASDGTGATISDTERPVLVYTLRQGLYGGAAVKAGAIAPDDKANRLYYDRFLTMRDILFDKKVQPTSAAADLAARINTYSTASKP